MRFDLVLSGGTVVDGTGAPARAADVGVLDGRVAAVGDLADVEAPERLDVTGRTVVPGFVDVHAHTDLAAYLPGELEDVVLAGVRQGVTTEVCGNCGLSPFPRTREHAADVDRNVAGLFPHGAPTFDSLAAWREALGRLPLAVNLAPLLGHGSLRGAVMGFADRAPTGDELAAMERLAAQAMDDGAFGLSTGLIYPPGVYSATGEITVLARVAARYGRPYTTHMRDEADRVDVAVREAVRIGRDAGAAVQVSHHKVAGRRNWGRSQQTLALVERARARGLDVTLDVYPYTAGSTALRALLPPWANDGGVDALLGRLADRSARRRIDRDYERGIPGWQDLVAQAGWSGTVVASATSEPDAEGRSVAELAAASGRPPVDVVADLLLADPHAMVVLHMMDERDVAAIDGQPFAMLGSDGIPLPGRQHPRLAGSFARALRTTLDRHGPAGLPDRVHRMTGLPARRFGLPGRGTVEVGAVADLVVFDPATVRDHATYADPLARPAGIEHVLLAGDAVIRVGQDTGRRLGRVLEPA